MRVLQKNKSTSSRTRSLLVVALIALTFIPASSSGAQDARFDPTVVRELPTNEVSTVRAALALGNVSGARTTAESLLPSASGDTRARLLYMAAKCAEELEDEAGARRHYEELSGLEHPLQRWARLHLAALLLSDTPEQVVSRLEGLSDERWAGRERARTLTALAQLRQGQRDLAIPTLRDLIASTPSSRAGSRVAMPLAAALSAMGGDERLEEALSLYRRVHTRGPATSVGRRAARHAESVLARISPDRRRPLRALPFADAMAKGRAYYNSMMHSQAESAFADAASVATDRAETCEARLMVGRAVLRARERPRAAELLGEVARDCEGFDDTKAWALYLGARALARSGQVGLARPRYMRVVNEHPTHRLADDSLLKSALIEGGRDNEAEMLTLLEQVATRFPQGDMRGEARFRLFARAYRESDNESALQQIEALLREGPLERDEGIEGRAEYWRARTLQRLGRDEALPSFERVVAHHPLSYYSQQAIARLREADSDRAQRAIARLGAPPEGPEGHLVFPVRDELSDPAFVRTLELLRVGETAEATSELDTLGMLGEGADRDALWLAAAVLDAAGAHPEASALVRRRLSSFRSVSPAADGRHYWRLAYPRAFSPQIERAATEASVPPAYVRGVAREESAFNPRAVSTAHAYGLIQLIRTTAREQARHLDLPSTPAALMRPEINLRIGSRFISSLWRRYDGHAGIVPAAYNAGPGAADRWIRAAPDQDFDLWVESIPYDETRRYTRRVLQSYGVYAWLDQGVLLDLPLRLPSR